MRKVKQTPIPTQKKARKPSAMKNQRKPMLGESKIPPNKAGVIPNIAETEPSAIPQNANRACSRKTFFRMII